MIPLARAGQAARQADHRRRRGRAAVYQPPTPEVITRALGALGIAGINQLLKRTAAGSTSSPTCTATAPAGAAELDLPYGVTATRDPAAPRAARLRAAPPAVGDLARGGAARARRAAGAVGRLPRHLQDQAARLAAAAGRDRPTCSAAVPFGTDPRGRPCRRRCSRLNWLIGAAPGQGKTSAVRVRGLRRRAGPAVRPVDPRAGGQGRPGTAGPGLPPVRAPASTTRRSATRPSRCGCCAPSWTRRSAQAEDASRGRPGRTARSPATWPASGGCGCARWWPRSMRCRTCSCTRKLRRAGRRGRRVRDPARPRLRHHPGAGHPAAGHRVAADRRSPGTCRSGSASRCPARSRTT